MLTLSAQNAIYVAHHSGIARIEAQRAATSSFYCAMTCVLAIHDSIEYIPVFNSMAMKRQETTTVLRKANVWVGK